MAEKYRFFDAVLQEDGVTYDREYDAQEFTDYFKALVTTGLMKGAGNQLTVTANGSNMNTRINTGIAFLLGRYYENDSFKELIHDTETLGNSRIDRIVIRMDLSTEARYVKSFIKKGVPSTNPVPPALTQTANLYEISLAQVKVVGGQTFISTNAVTDERGKDIICPWAGSEILPNFNDDDLENLVNSQMLNNGKSTFLGIGDDMNLVRKSGWYNGTSGVGLVKNMPPTGPNGYLVEVIEHSGGYVTQTARSINSPETVWTRQGWPLPGGHWNSWVVLSANIMNIYIDPDNGSDADGYGWSSGNNAFKTVPYALHRLPRIIGYQVTLNLGKGRYPAINISNYNGKFAIVGAGPETLIDSMSVLDMSRVHLSDFDLVYTLDLRSVTRFSVQNVNSIQSTAVDGFYILASTGAFFGCNVSAKNFGAAIKVDNGSNIILDSVVGANNRTGLDVELSIIRRRSSQITGSTPTRVANGGQIL